jgi:hypothetical protein
MPYPQGVETIEDAIQFLGMKPGDHVFATGTCGDNWEGKSVVYPRGQPGILKNIYLNGPWWMIEVDYIDHPGRPTTCASFRDALALWSLREPLPIPSPPPPPPPPPETRYEHLLAGTFDF